MPRSKDLGVIARSFQRLLLGAAACATLLAGAAMAEPAIWVVKDADSTIYLFGTVHILRPETVWRTPRIDEAMARSTELWLEINEPKDEAELMALMTPLMAQHGFAMDKPLSARLTPEEQVKLAKAVKDAGLPDEAAAMVNFMRPWLVATLLGVAPLQKAGYDPKAGVETVLSAAASAQGDALKSFEKVDQQLMFLANLPDEVQMQFLRDTLNDFDIAETDAMVAHWVAGDVASLEREMIAEMKAETPQLYEVLVIKRNEDWANQIETRLKGSGVSFMAVGAAHLAGPDSVQVKLKAKNITAERY